MSRGGAEVNCGVGRQVADVLARSDVDVAVGAGPDVLGLDVCRAIRADADPYLRKIPIALLTALTASEDTQVAFDAGATDYLTKPFGTAHLRARVHEWLLRGARA